ncbi:host-nuclease inhibitor Gam family protein [Halarsenatibacter silvermanii]|uniref:Bacteriophage Mu Gam like protein n=1 Tax=Halarsenatibacter silvermanii TaxID=321763 RepID=A0A1G9RUV6_9FIRM|nr:host-nuclease inhibitor Gam family protein [Halarsenatibacter silvermanii]SDM26962.1 Bacteriophage Mu Gam like protein [Halarsenatibacter silvermanii]
MAEPAHKLDNLEIEVKPAEEREEKSGFVIDNDEKASWALRKVRDMKRKQKANEELAQAQIEKIKEDIQEIKSWLDDENSKIQNNIDFMKEKLENYAHRLRDEDPDLKTYNLPFGALKFRKQRPKWKYDEDKLLDFVENNFEDALKIKKKVSKRELKKQAEVTGNKAVIEDTGEVIEGVTVTHPPEKFKVDVKE